MPKQNIRKKGAKREFPTKLALCSFILLLLTYLLCQLPHVQWQSNLSTYMTEIKGVTSSEYGNLWSLNGALIVLGQLVLIPVVNRFKNTYLHKFISVFSYLFYLLLWQ